VVSDGMAVVERSLDELDLSPLNGSAYPLRHGGRVEAVLLLDGVAQGDIEREGSALLPLLDLATIALRNARLADERDEAVATTNDLLRQAEARAQVLHALHEVALARASDPVRLAQLTVERARALLAA